MLILYFIHYDLIKTNKNVCQHVYISLQANYRKGLQTT
jgi:hypothetical protein